MPENLKYTSFTFIEHTHCPSCKSNRIKYIGMRGGKYQREGKGIETRIVRCSNCSLIFPNPFPIPESLESLYEDYEEFHDNRGDSEGVAKYYELIAEKFISEIGKKEKIHLLEKDIQRKLDSPMTGPYVITAVHANGNLTIQKGAVSDHINIWRCKPYIE